MQDAIKQKRSLFIDRWAKAEYINAKLGTMLFALSVVCVLLAGALIYSTIGPKSIYYIDSNNEAGVAYPKQVPESSIMVFTTSWVLSWSNFTPATVNHVYARAQRFMSPALLAKTRERLSKDMDEVKRNNISSLFTLKEEPKFEKDDQGYMITLKGEKSMLMGKETISLEHMIYRVSLKSVNPTESNPYGIVVDDVDQEINRS